MPLTYWILTWGVPYRKWYLNAFNECSHSLLTYYKGADFAAWQKITVGSNNNALLYNPYFYSENEPQSAGRYWHFDGSGNIVLW